MTRRRVIRPSLTVTLTLIATVMVALPAPGSAATTSATCANLQSVLDTSTTGDVITLHGTCSGSYTLKAGAAVTLQGAPGAGFDGGGTAQPLHGSDIGLTTIRDLVFRNGSATDGGAIAITGNSSPQLMKLEFFGNRASGHGGAVYVSTPSGSHVVISDSTFGSASAGAANVAAQTGGALAITSDQSVDLSDDRFMSNQAANGGAMSTCSLSGIVSIDNAVIAGNSVVPSGSGAGIGSACGHLEIYDSTLIQNSGGAQLSGDGVSALRLTNTIVWPAGVSDFSQLDAGTTAPGDGKIGGFNDVCSSPRTPLDGAGNICEDPLLVNPATGDVHETPSSATVDRGSNALVPPSLTGDYEGQPRIFGLAVDIGADEFVPAPSATTGSASVVRASSAQLGGTVNPHGAATTYRFEFGTSNAYGRSTPSRAAGAGTLAQSVTTALTGLTPNTTYHYRLIATNGVGATTGGDRSFKTRPPPFLGAGIRTTSAKLDPHGRAPVELSCPANTIGKCAGKLTLTASVPAPNHTHRRVTIGSAKFSIPAGASATIKVELSATALGLIKKNKKLTAQATATARDNLARTKTTTGTLTFKPAG